jgi:hypothetical protein
VNNKVSQDLKVLVLDDYEGFAASVPSYQDVKVRAGNERTLSDKSLLC